MGNHIRRVVERNRLCWYYWKSQSKEVKKSRTVYGQKVTRGVGVWVDYCGLRQNTVKGGSGEKLATWIKDGGGEKSNRGNLTT